MQTTNSQPDNYIFAILGGFIADAATMGLHWIYDPLEIERLVETRPSSDPAFFEPPSSPFYQYVNGEFSPYGAEALGILKALASQPNISGQELTIAFVEYMRNYDGYKNKATRYLIENVDAGLAFPNAAPDDGQANALTKVPAAVARYSGRPDFQRKVEDTVRAHQNSDLAVRCGVAAAVILDRIATSAAAAFTAANGPGPARGAAELVRAALEWAASAASPKCCNWQPPHLVKCRHGGTA